MLKRGTEQLPNAEAEELITHEIPAWFMKSLKKITYTFPKAHAVEYGVMLIKLMYYSMNYPK